MATHTDRATAYGLVAAGGGLGALLRAGLGRLLPGVAGTLVANVVGAVLLGALATRFLEPGRVTRRTRLVAATGLLSSFTTYSTFAVQSALAPGPALLAANVLATYGLGLAGAAAGRAVGRHHRGGGR